MKSKFSPEQRAQIIKEAKNGSISAVAKKYSIKANLLYSWMSKSRKLLTISAPKKPANKTFDEVAFLKSELEKRDKIILQFALKYIGQNL